ncbi:MAG: hypothetical protein KAX84_00245 [Burkholderiales bacterium]|nr:hypothetical protein [Burkholderiales bacterium]
MATTLVTGFIDLGAREARPPGKALDDYVRHARWLLAAGAPLVVFAEPHALAQLLPLRRAGAPTRWIAIDFASLRWHPALPRIAAAAAGPASSWLNPAKDTPGYLAVTYEKTEWLGRAARENPFGTTAFAWVDLGIASLATVAGRVALSELDAGLADLSAAARPGALRACAIEAVPADALSRREVYYARPRWPVAGGVLAGGGADIAWFAGAVAAEIGACLDAGIASTEEMVWGAVLHRHPERFACRYGTHGSCLANFTVPRADVHMILDAAWRAFERDCRDQAEARLAFVAPALDSADAQSWLLLGACELAKATRWGSSGDARGAAMALFHGAWSDPQKRERLDAAWPRLAAELAPFAADVPVPAPARQVRPA